MKLESSLIGLTGIAGMGLASLLIACSGSTQIGESSTGDGGSSGSVSSGGGGGSSSGGTENDPTSTSGTTGGDGGVGGSAGPSSTGGTAGNPGSGGSAATASTATGGTGGTPCQGAEDCPPPGVGCELCADGSQECPYFECIEGECVASFPTCEGTCTEDSDCPVSLAPCQVCVDGTSACPWARCVEGSCKNGTDVCPGVNPCEGKECGDDCSACEPDSPNCNNVRMYCNEELECQSNVPMCSALACDADGECPLVDACPLCADGTCAEMQCVDGTCQFECQGDGGCSGDGESCAGGASCCSGLTCCAGVPVPEGAEYCSASDCPDSDVNLKTDFASVDPNLVLERLAALPISTWSYKTEASRVKHIGPMAQDFMAAFEVGRSDRAIAKVDADGVAFAAIQALNARLQALEARNAELERRLSNAGDGACSR